ncbi:MAG: PAS domain S-box protein [Microscillaceae bacterium]|nr:PAS domain S-box protein [Microscillaceae bacterium]
MDNYLKNELYNLIRRDETIFDFIQEEALRGFCYLDLEKNHFWMNPKLKMVLGYVSNNTLEGLTWKDFIHPEDFVQLKQSLQETHFSHQVFDHNLQCLHQEGYFIRLQGKSKVFFSDSNTPHRLLIAHAEISMDARSVVTKNVFEDFFERSGELLSIATPEGRFVKINQAWEKTLGYTIEDLNYGKFLDLIHPDDMEATLKAIREVTEGKEIRDFINRYRHKDGSYRTIEWQSIVREDLVYSISRDITEKVQTEKKLKNNEEIFHNITKSLPCTIFQYQLFPDGKDKILFVSRGEELLHPVDPTEVLKQSDIIWATILPEDIPHLRNSILESAQNLSFWRCEWRTRGLDGSIKWILGQGTPKMLEDGSVIWNTLSLDITETKKILEEKTKTYDLLHNLMDSMADGFVALDKNWIYTYVNASAGNMLGRNPKDLIGKNIWVEFPEGIGLPFYHHYHQAVKTQTAFNFEEYFEPWDRWFENRLFPTEEGLSIFFQDITSRKKLELQIQEQNFLLKGIIESSEDPIFSVNTTYRYTSFNEAHRLALKKIYGTEVRLGEISLDFITDNQERMHAKDKLDRALMGEHLVEENIFGLADLERRYYKVSHRPIWDDQGNIQGVSIFAYDTTQEKIITQQLIASQERFQALVEHSKDIFILTHPHQLIYVSPNIKEILGYTAEEFAQIHPEDIIHPDDLPMRWSELQAPGSSLSLEYQILHKNGQWRYIEAFGKNLHHLEHINAMVFNLRDISERKEYEQEIIQKNRDLAASEEELRISEEELKANIEELLVVQAELKTQKTALEVSEEKYRKVVENQTDFVLLSFPDTTISFANQPLAEALGISLSEIIGKKWVDFASVEDLSFVENKIALLSSSDDFFIWENRDQRAGGQWGWTQWVNQGFFDTHGKLLQIQSVGRDITELKHIQEALSTSESEARALARMYKSILDSQAVYVIKTDLQGFYTFVNDYFKEKFGYLGDFIGTSALDNIIEADRDACRDAVEKCFVQPELPHEVILRKIDKDGVIKGAKWEFKGVLDESGEVSEILCVGFDISEQLESLDRLKHLLDVTSDQNNRLQNFAHIISHNIRSHSANLTSLVNFMQEAECEEEKEMYFQMLVQSTAKLDDTITNLNEIISIHQAFNKPKEKLLLRQQIDKTLEVLSGLVLQKNIQIYNDVPAEIYIRAIPAYLDSILLNVLSNAVKYCDPSKPELFIRIITYKTEEFLVVSIQDNGLGFDAKKNAHKIFGMYKTFHKNEDARGLGLFITKNQIEAMGGKIEVESEIAIGSTFNIFFRENS